MTNLDRTKHLLIAVMVTVFLAGCASISENTHAYLGSPTFTPTDPATVKILESEPTGAKIRLGEIILAVDGKPKREDIERKIREAAAKLGAEAAFVVHDRTHIYPVVHTDYWWGPTWVTQDSTRNIVAIAFRYQ